MAKERNINLEKHVEALLEKIDDERDNLSQAMSVLQCMKTAMEAGEESGSGPHYPDVAGIAIEMIRKVHNALDSVNLPSAIKGTRRSR